MDPLMLERLETVVELAARGRAAHDADACSAGT